MSRLTMGPPAESIFMSNSKTIEDENLAAMHNSAATRGAEFAAELEHMPTLPGFPIVQTINDQNLPTLATQKLDSTIVSPCVFSQ